MEGCTNSFCMIPRCADCKHNFVKAPGQCCSSCAPSKRCERCKKHTSILREFNTIPFAKKLVCNTCFHTVCRQCDKEAYNLNEKLICTTCAADNAWMLDGDWEGRWPTGEHECKDCGNVAYLNAERLCKTCFELRQKYYTRHCVDCEAKMYPTHPGDVLCDNCKPHCKGCSRKFMPATRDVTLCPSCSALSVAGKGNCSSCGEYSYVLDNEAHCPVCSNDYYAMIDNTTEIQWCKRCYRNRTAFGAICKPCLSKTHYCPQCYDNIIDANEYVCRACVANNAIQDR